MKDCEKRIVVYYVECYDINRITEIAESLKNFFDETVKLIVVPVRDKSLVKVECITEKDNEKEAFQNLIDYINNKIEENVKEGEA